MKLEKMQIAVLTFVVIIALYNLISFPISPEQLFNELSSENDSIRLSMSQLVLDDNGEYVSEENLGTYFDIWDEIPVQMYLTEQLQQWTWKRVEYNDLELHSSNVIRFSGNGFSLMAFEGERFINLLTEDGDLWYIPEQESAEPYEVFRMWYNDVSQAK